MTTTDTTTIRDFLALPHEAMPHAQFLDDEDGSAWNHLRDYIRPDHAQRLNHTGERVRLSADRDGWRDGVLVTLD